MLQGRDERARALLRNLEVNRPAVLVTGGARRIGAALARRFGAQGWHVAIHCHRSRKEAEALAAQLPSAEVVACDLADPSAAVALVEGLAERLEDWRALVNCASVLRPDAASALDRAIFAEAMRVNAESPALMAQAYLARARSSAGRRVIQVTDQKTANPNPDFFSYTMSKHALAATVAMLDIQEGTRPDDRIYALAPGAILPSLDQSESEAEHSHRMNLLARRTSAQEVAEAAWWLATGPLAGGQVLFVDSGQHLVPQPRDVIYLARQQGIGQQETGQQGIGRREIGRHGEAA